LIPRLVAYLLSSSSCPDMTHTTVLPLARRFEKWIHHPGAVMSCQMSRSMPRHVRQQGFAMMPCLRLAAMPLMPALVDAC